MSAVAFLSYRPHNNKMAYLDAEGTFCHIMTRSVLMYLQSKALNVFSEELNMMQPALEIPGQVLSLIK